MGALVRDAAGLGTSGGSTTQTASLSGLNAGSDILVSVFNESGVAISSVTDSKGNTYTQLGSEVTASASTELWVAYNVAASATAVTVTATWASTASYPGVHAAEWSWLKTSAVLDVSGTITTTGNWVQTTSATTAKNDVIYALLANAGTGIGSSGSLTVLPAASSAFGTRYAVAYDIQYTTGTYSISWTNSGTFAGLYAGLFFAAGSATTSEGSLTSAPLGSATEDYGSSAALRIATTIPSWPSTNMDTPTGVHVLYDPPPKLVGQLWPL